MRITPVLLIAFAATVAGCVNPIQSGLAPAALGGEAMDHYHLPFGLTGCNVVIGIVPVDAEKVAPLLPEGFRVLTPQEIGLPADPRGADGNLAFESFRCDEVAGLEKNVTDGVYGSIFAYVEVPEELQVEGIDLYFVKWDVLVADKALRAALVEAGVPAMDGDANPITNVAPVMGRGPIQGSLVLGESTYGFNGAAAQMVSFEPGRFREFTPTPNGLVRWTTNYTFEWASTGAGYMRVPASGMAFDVLGQERSPAFFLYGRVAAFDQGDIYVPTH